MGQWTQGCHFQNEAGGGVPQLVFGFVFLLSWSPGGVGAFREREAVPILTRGLRRGPGRHQGMCAKRPLAWSPAPSSRRAGPAPSPSRRPDPSPARLPDPGADPPPSRLPSQERGCHAAPAPAPARAAHPVAGGASSCSQSASRAPRPARARRRLWARAPQAASQEDANVGRRVSGASTAPVSIRPPPAPSSPGTSLPVPEFPLDRGPVEEPLPTGLAPNLPSRGFSPGRETSSWRHACAYRRLRPPGSKAARGRAQGGSMRIDGTSAGTARRRDVARGSGAVFLR